MTTTIEHPIYNKIYLHNTHIQSDSFIGIYRRCRTIRKSQYDEIIDYFNNFDKEDLHIFSGDLNEDYDDNHFKYLVEHLDFRCHYNKNKIVTFPSDNRQLDYIITNIENTILKYGFEDTDLSDHLIFNLELDNDDENDENDENNETNIKIIMNINHKID